ncbi:non-structural maintenance of chromosomes element 1 homolog [Neodiprion pinetum]|uniref:Non-structural maintenance of chromosomes element 1 homolog n=1 Tax=Neodiprion lecontei TaxID=441921 RepID=A0A6J0CD16_NEOLC|nr:non-structural maintenance of chromosomes element 1 homolog [Neodiprion lecontei]XP_046467180.1 non-structural maintenance of chromosomes element 1 homolog [Neodiprion pinetum]XP_046467181.1 non-structural maintenance of chromosomes element 1 homolog [Neodiprion pinetum]XP_046587055.1 non-structural maintenance of chromosomes element 1 homolog [Neodiprion lecontei]
MSYTNNHRALLQVIMERGAVSTADARELIVKLFQQNESTQTYIHQINVKLEPLNMTIKLVTCELTGHKYWILISTLIDKTASFQNEFSPAQLELLRKILSEIITSDDGCAPSTACLNLCSSLDTQMSKADAEDFLAKMVEKKWFVKEHGKFYMGVRSIAELIPYFKASYSEEALKTCALCRQMVFHGERCICCHNVLHMLCFANCARVQNPPKCPSCNTIMSTDNINDFDAYNDHVLDFPEMSVETENSEKRTTNPTKKRKYSAR